MAKGDAWIIYEQFPPYSPRFVARRYRIRADGALCGPEVAGHALVGATIEAVRRQLPDGLSPLPEAAPRERLGAAIVETWI